MKKKLLFLMLCVTLGLSVSACGNDDKKENKDNNTQTESQANTQAESELIPYEGVRSTAIEISLDDLVKELPAYNPISVTINGNYEVKDKDVEDTLMSLLAYYGKNMVEVKDHTVVEKGDYVKIDYTGYKDGVAFANGAATDVIMDPVNNMDMSTQGYYIDGFCDDMIGAKVGDVLKTDVTFPEQYHSADLAGQPAVFEIKIKGIYRAATMADLDDAWVKENFAGSGIETKDALVSYVREMLEANAESTKDQDILSAVQDYMLENTKVEIPEDYLQARISEIEYSTTVDNCKTGQTLEEFFEANGTDLETERTQWELTLNKQIKIEFIFGKIADLENIQVDDTELGQYIDYLIQSNSDKFKDADAVYEYYGVGSLEDGKKALRQLYRVTKAVSFVSDKANVTIAGEQVTDTNQEGITEQEDSEGLE